MNEIEQRLPLVATRSQERGMIAIGTNPRFFAHGNSLSIHFSVSPSFLDGQVLSTVLSTHGIFWALFEIT
jgi:hypothetical protein